MFLHPLYILHHSCVLLQVIEAQPDMPIFGAVTLYSSLLTFTLHVHPDRLDYVDQVLVCLFPDCLQSHMYAKGRVYIILLHIIRVSAV